MVIASFRSRNGEALKVAEKFQGGGHANASGAMFPKSIRNIPEAVDYLRTVLNPKRGAPLNNLESLFAGIEAEQRSKATQAGSVRITNSWRAFLPLPGMRAVVHSILF